MKAKLAIFLVLALFSLFFATIAEGAQSTIKLEVLVLPNIISYFDGKDIITKTNDSQPVVVTKEKIQFPEESGYEYTITPGL
jgi:hypothetical protein